MRILLTSITISSGKTMSTKPPTDRDTDGTAQKRAQWERFSFDVNAPGIVDVVNECHKNPVEHQYIISIDEVTVGANGLYMSALRSPHRILQAHGRCRKRN